MTGKHSSVPVFRTEAEERAFRESHDSSGHVDWSKAEGVRFANLKPSTKAISPGSSEKLSTRVRLDRCTAPPYTLEP